MQEMPHRGLCAGDENEIQMRQQSKSICSDLESGQIDIDGGCVSLLGLGSLSAGRRLYRVLNRNVLHHSEFKVQHNLFRRFRARIKIH